SLESPIGRIATTLEQGLIGRRGAAALESINEETFSMNKKLMAVAVAGALGAPGLAVAQVGSSPGITLYGRLDSAIMSNKFSATDTAITGAGATLVPSAHIAELKKGDVFSPG